MSMNINYGNVYVANKTTRNAIKTLRTGNPAAIVVNEGKNVNRIRGYREYVSPHGDMRGRTDVRVFVKKNLEHLGALTVRIQEQNERFAASHERYAVAAMFLHPELGKVAVVGVHPSPGPKALVGEDPLHPIAKSYEKAMTAVEGLVKYLEGQGFRVVVAGDVQVRQTAPLRPWNPFLRMREMGFALSASQHLDAMWHSGHSLRCLHARVLGNAAATGSDHPFLTAAYTKAK